MDKPISSLHFWGMSLAFAIRDLLAPPQRVLDEVQIRAGANVLDFGCGPGSYTLLVAERVGPDGKVFAVDIHPKAVQTVRRRSRTRGLANVEALCAADPTALAAQSIDVVLFYDTLHMLGDQDRVLRGLHGVLKPGGILSLSDHHMKQSDILEKVTGTGLFKLAEKGKRSYRFLKSGPQ
jgi:ubiquinone/menaquinone biosynthesis C-methylase UbiE